MPLNENQKIVVAADMTYDTVVEKLLYVNGKLGYLDEQGEILHQYEHVAWNYQKYYRELGTIETKTLQRLYEIAKHFKEDTLNQMELFEEMQRGKLQMYRQAKAKGLYRDANSISDSLISMQPYLSSMREAIKHIMQEDIVAFEKTKGSNFLPDSSPSSGRSGKGERLLQKSSRKD